MSTTESLLNLKVDAYKERVMRCNMCGKQGRKQGLRWGEAKDTAVGFIMFGTNEG